VKRRSCEFFLEQIDLVQEEDNGRLDEPAGVADGVEKSESLLHSVDGLILIEHLVIFGQGDQEDEGGDIFKAMNPFLTFTPKGLLVAGTGAIGDIDVPLTSDVEETVSELAYSEHCLGDTRCLDTRSQNILVGRHVAGVGHALDRIKVTNKNRIISFRSRGGTRCRKKRRKKYSLNGGIVELEFTSPVDSALNSRISPESSDCIGNVPGKRIRFELNWETHNRGPSSIVLGRKLDIKGWHSLKDGPHGLDGIRIDDFLVRLAFLLIVTTVMNKLHLLEDSRLASGQGRSCQTEVFQEWQISRLTFPDSPAPSNNILISFLA